MPKSPKRRQQFAAIPYRQTEDGLEVVLITSRGTGRWVVPKGWPMEDKRPHRAAEIEAYKEAGVVGKAVKRAIGRYDYLKDGLVPCRVVLFALPVDQLLDEWPEDGERRRQWFSLVEAAERVAEPELQVILRYLSVGFSSGCSKGRNAKATRRLTDVDASPSESPLGS